MEPMTDEEDTAWFTFTVRETDGDGVDVPKLTRLLEQLSSTFYHIARTKLGTDESRRGPRTQAEDKLAAIRLVRVSPGSTLIELAPPPGATRVQLAVTDEPTPDDVAHDFLEEVQRIEAGDPASEDRMEVRRKVRAVIEDAGEIGARAEIVFRPIVPRPHHPPDDVLKAAFRTRELPADQPPQQSTRTRRVSGHAFMVDVEPGRPRLRIKLPDGRDVTLDVDEKLLAQISTALDRVVEVDIEEGIEGTVISSRLARGLLVLPTSGPGSDKPPKSIDQLVEEQDLPDKRPDYRALASAIWETEEEVTEFQELLNAMRVAEPN